MKKEVLGLLGELGRATAKEVGDHLGWSHASVAMALLRYHRQGLVSRYMQEGKTSARIYGLISTVS